jgi:hypothetical protein
VLCNSAQDISAHHKEAIEQPLRPWFANMKVATIADAGHSSMLEVPVLLTTLVERGLPSGSILR